MLAARVDPAILAADWGDLGENESNLIRFSAGSLGGFGDSGGRLGRLGWLCRQLGRFRRLAVGVCFRSGRGPATLAATWGGFSSFGGQLGAARGGSGGGSGGYGR